MMDKDTAKIILGEWIRGNHAEDIKVIPPAEFGELAPVADQIRAGETNPTKIGARCKGVIGMDEIALMQSGSYEALYQSAVWAYIDSYRADWIRKHANASPQEIIEFVEKTQRDWMTEVPEERNLTDVVEDYLTTLDDRKNRKVTLTGVEDLDELTGGIIPGTLTAIGARPGTGKSAFCLQTAVNVARSGHKVLFLALEMTEAQNMDRLMMMYARGIDQKALRSGNLTPEQWDEIGTASEKIAQMDGKLSFSYERDVVAIKRMVEKHKPDLLIVDQLSQMSDKSQSFPSTRERFSHMTKELMDIAMNGNEGKTAVWVACQVNRDADNQKPTMANLKESGSIEEDCDNVILLYRDKDEEEARNMTGNRIINIEVAKHRGGEPGEFQVKFTPSRFLFTPLEDMPPGFYETQEEINF